MFGGAGADGGTGAGSGGWNGGANGVNSGKHGVGGGGGGTDIRVDGNNYANRIIVAGGGGGAERDGNASYWRGFDGGAGGATDSGGFQPGLGQTGPGGGGGGYYGGVAVNLGVSRGGSSYIGGVLEGQTKAGNQSFTAPGGGSETGHGGNGYARITLVE